MTSLKSTASPWLRHPRALQVLRDKGLVNTVNRSGCYLAAVDGPALDRFALCLRTTPGVHQRVSANVTRVGFEAVAGGLGMTLLADDPFDLTASARRLVRQAQKAVLEGLSGYFLMPAARER